MSGIDIILVAPCPAGKQEGYATCCTAETCKAHLETALRALGVPYSRITTDLDYADSKCSSINKETWL